MAICCVGYLHAWLLANPFAVTMIELDNPVKKRWSLMIMWGSENITDHYHCFNNDIYIRACSCHLHTRSSYNLSVIPIWKFPRVMHAACLSEAWMKTSNQSSKEKVGDNTVQGSRRWQIAKYIIQKKGKKLTFISCEFWLWFGNVMFWICTGYYSIGFRK